jgi:hypothetical protein
VEGLQKGIIIKVLEKDLATPKAQHRWMRHIEYDPDRIDIGLTLHMYYDNFNKITITSPVTKREEDENNLIIHTENSIYYIKKIND